MLNIRSQSETSISEWIQRQHIFARMLQQSLKQYVHDRSTPSCAGHDNHVIYLNLHTIVAQRGLHHVLQRVFWKPVNNVRAVYVRACNHNTNEYISGSLNFIRTLLSPKHPFPDNVLTITLARSIVHLYILIENLIAKLQRYIEGYGISTNSLKLPASILQFLNSAFSSTLWETAPRCMCAVRNTESRRIEAWRL